MQPGEVQRWRLLNATDGDNLQLVLVSSVNPTARSRAQRRRDGRDYGAENLPPRSAIRSRCPSTALVIGPGQRMDVMVKAPSTPGTYLLQTIDPNSGEIKASVSPYRDSNFPNGIDPAWRTVPAQF